MLFLHRRIALGNRRHFRHRRLRVTLGIDQASLVDPKLLSGVAKLFGCVVDLDEAAAGFGFAGYEGGIQIGRAGDGRPKHAEALLDR